MKNTITLLFLIGVYGSLSCQTFQILYDDIFFYEVKKSPNNFLYSWAFENSTSVSNLIIAKHDFNGEVLFFNRLNALISPQFARTNNRLQFFSDHSIFIAASYIDTVTNYATSNIANFDENLNMQWAKQVPIGILRDIITYNNKAIITTTVTFCSSLYYLLAAEFNNLGDYHWSRVYWYTDSLGIDGNMIAKTRNNRFLITNQNTDSIKCFIMIDSVGNVLWDRVYNFQDYELNTSRFESDGDDFLCIGYIDGDFLPITHPLPFFMKIDSLGNINDFKIYNFDHPYFIQLFNIISDGNKYYLTGNVAANPLYLVADINGDILIAKHDSNSYDYINATTNAIVYLMNNNILISGKKHLTVLDATGSGFCYDKILDVNYVQAVSYIEEFTHTLTSNDYPIFYDDTVYATNISYYDDSLLCYILNRDDNYSGENNYHVIYPNPFHNILHINVENIQSVQLYDLFSRKIFEINDCLNEIELSYLEDGMYVIKVLADSKVFCMKIIKD